LGLGGHSVDIADADSAQELGGGRHVEVEGVLGLALEVSLHSCTSLAGKNKGFEVSDSVSRSVCGWGGGGGSQRPKCVCVCVICACVCVWVGVCVCVCQALVLEPTQPFRLLGNRTQ
jgi:hypothetical protein